MLVEWEWLQLVRRARAAQRRPHLSFTGIDPPQLIEEVRLTVFPEIVVTLRCFFVDGPFLGCISRRPGHDEANIFLHDILNRAEIPAPVFQHIFIHEIIHLLVPPREIKGKLKAHLPEFWELEKRLSPQSADAWDWIEFNFSKVLREDRRNESDRVRRNWKNAAPVALLGWEDVLGIDDSARIEFVRKTVSFNVTYAAARQAAKDAFAKTRAVAEVNPTPLLPQGAPAGERTGIAPSCRTVE